MEGAEERRDRLGDDLPEREPTAPRVPAEGAHHTHWEFERDGHCPFHHGNGSAQCGGLLEVTVRLPSRQRELVGKLPGGIGGLDPPPEQPIGGI